MIKLSKSSNWHFANWSLHELAFGVSFSELTTSRGFCCFFIVLALVWSCVSQHAKCAKPESTPETTEKQIWDLELFEWIVVVQWFDVCMPLLFSSSPKDILTDFRERGRETWMWERNINWLPLLCTQTGNPTSDFSVCGTTPNQLSHITQGKICNTLYGKFHLFTHSHKMILIILPNSCIQN